MYLISEFIESFHLGGRWKSLKSKRPNFNFKSADSGSKEAPAASTGKETGPWSWRVTGMRPGAFARLGREKSVDQTSSKRMVIFQGFPL